MREGSGATDNVRAGSAKSPVTSRTKCTAVAKKPVAFETRWRAAEPVLQASIRQLSTYLQAYEDEKGMRIRARRAADREKFEQTVEVICCNFAAVAMFDSGRRLVVKLGNYASSLSPVYGKHFNRVLDLMLERELITKAKGHSFSGAGRVPSTVHPTSAYWNRVGEPAGWNALHLEDDRKPIVLNTSRDCTTTTADETISQDQLVMMESEVARINEHLKATRLGFAGNVIHAADVPSSPAVFLITPHHRTVRRVFNGNYDRGGRLFGGVWQTLPREERFKHLTISGQPVVNVDWSQLFLHLCYAEAKRTPPPGDLYDLTGNDHERRGWLSLRQGRKRLVNALIFVDKKLNQWPGRTVAQRAEISACFPRGTRPGVVLREIRERHHAIAQDRLEKGHGMNLMRVESDMLVAVLLRLIDIGIKALPLHDSVIVARPDGEAARRIMVEEAQRLTGANIPVKIDAG